MKLIPLILAVFIISLLSSCKNNGGSCDGKSALSGNDSTANETQLFLKHFKLVKAPFNTDGIIYSVRNENLLIDTTVPRFKDTGVMFKRDFNFLQRSGIALPDTFYPAAYFDCHGFYLCMIRNIPGKLSHDLGEDGWNSALLTIDSTGVLDMLQNTTVQDIGTTYKRCWVQNLDSDNIPEVVIRVLDARDEPEARHEGNPEVYKITDGKFKPAIIKLDTAAYSFWGL